MCGQCIKCSVVARTHLVQASGKLVLKKRLFLPDVEQILVDVLVEQILRNVGERVGLEVEVLQLSEAVESSLANFVNLVVVQRKPEQLLKWLQGLSKTRKVKTI